MTRDYDQEEAGFENSTKTLMTSSIKKEPGLPVIKEEIVAEPDDMEISNSP